MRVKLGSFAAACALVVTMIATGVAGPAASAAPTTDDTVAVESTESSTTTSSTSSSTTTTPTTTTAAPTTTPTTTTTVPGGLDGAASVDGSATRSSTDGDPSTSDSGGIAGPALADASADRSAGQFHLVTPPVAPTTTTIPPLWALPANSGEGRRLVYSKTNQWVWAVEADGSVSKHHAVSGRRTWNQPLPGTYNVFSRSSYTCSILDPSVCWRYMVRFTKGPGGDNIGFHEIPTNLRTGNRLQADWQLGQPLSAGCIRQSTSDALWVWNWAPVGTRVVVLP